MLRTREKLYNLERPCQWNAAVHRHAAIIRTLAPDCCSSQKIEGFEKLWLRPCDPTNQVAVSSLLEARSGESNRGKEDNFGRRGGRNVLVVGDLPILLANAFFL